MAATLLSKLSGAQTWLNTQDFASLVDVIKSGLKLSEIRVSPVCSLRGKLLSSVSLPAKSRIMCIKRKGESPILGCEETFLRPGDEVLVLTEDEEAVRKLFMF